MSTARWSPRRFDADLTLTGSLAAGPLLGGTVFLDRTEITVPERLPRDSVAVDVEHVDPPPDGRRRRWRCARDGRSGASGGGEPAAASASTSPSMRRSRSSCAAAGSTRSSAATCG